MPQLIRAFQHKNYRLFFCGQLISLCGTWMQTLALPWFIYKMTGSAFLLGVVSFSSQIPIILFTPLGGAAADMVSKRKILLATQSLAMLFSMLLALLVLCGNIQIWQVIALTFLLGIVHSFDMPTRHSFIVEMVGKEDLPNAIALNSSMFNAARVIGPSAGGIIVASYGAGFCFLLNSVSFAAMIIALILMKLPPAEIKRRSESAVSSILSGFKYSWETIRIRNILLLVAIVSLFGMPYTVLMPIFVDNILNSGAQTLGILMGSAGAGAFSGAICLAMRKELKGIERWIALSSAGFGASLLLFSFSRSTALSAILLFPVGFCVVGQMASSNTLLQSISADNFRGRVMSAYSMMFLGMAPFGSLLAGFSAQHLGAPKTVAICGGVCILAAVFLGARLQKSAVHPTRLPVDVESADPVTEEE